VSDPHLFKRRHFQGATIPYAARWYLRYALSHRNAEELLREGGVWVDRTTVYRWVHRYAPELDKRCRPYLRVTNDSYWFVKRRVNPGLGFGTFHTAQQTIQGYEAIPILRKGQIEGLARGGILTQTRVIDRLFGLAA
jgi:transposase-like protein